MNPLSDESTFVGDRRLRIVGRNRAAATLTGGAAEAAVGVRSQLEAVGRAAELGLAGTRDGARGPAPQG